MSQVKVTGNNGGILPQHRSHALVALGSNMSSDTGSPVQTLLSALDQIEKAGAVIRAKSRFYSTPAVPIGNGPDFVNAVIALDSPWAAGELIAHLHQIEARLGRRRAERWGARIVDLDLLAVDDLVMPDVPTLRLWMDLSPEQQQQTAPAQLILPHPRMHQRGFVLVPLADVAPDWVHPITRRTVRQMRDALPQTELETITPLE